MTNSFVDKLEWQGDFYLFLRVNRRSCLEGSLVGRLSQSVEWFLILVLGLIYFIPPTYSKSASSSYSAPL